MKKVGSRPCTVDQYQPKILCSPLRLNERRSLAVSHKQIFSETCRTDLVKALKELNVDVTGVDRMTLNQQLAIMDLIALGSFLLLPSDDLNLANALKSPLFGISEEKLYKI